MAYHFMRVYAREAWSRLALMALPSQARRLTREAGDADNGIPGCRH